MAVGQLHDGIVLDLTLQPALGFRRTIRSPSPGQTCCASLYGELEEEESGEDSLGIRDLARRLGS